MTDKSSRTRNATVIALNGMAGVAYGLALTTHFPTLLFGGSKPVWYKNFVFDFPRGHTTTYDAKCLLKWRAIEAYGAHYFANVYMWSWTGWYGKPVQAGANLQLTILKTEYEIIDKIESFTANSIWLKDSIPPIMSTVYSYQSVVARGVRLQAARAASAAADRNMCVGEVAGRPSRANLGAAVGGIPSGTIPLVVDPAENPERTQLMRATYPWVQSWRAPFMIFAYAALSNSRATIFYEYHTDYFTKKVLQRFPERPRLQALRCGRPECRSPAHRQRVPKHGGSATIPNLQTKCSASLDLQERKLLLRIRISLFLPRTNPTPITAMAQAMQYNGLRPIRWTPGVYDKISFLIDRRPAAGTGLGHIELV